MKRNFSGIIIFLFVSVFIFPARAQWINTNANLGVDLNCVAFANDSTAVVGGKGRLFITTNKGVSWRVVGSTGTLNDTVSYYRNNFFSVVFTNMSFVAVGQDTVSHHAQAYKINPQGTSCTSTYGGGVSSALYDVCATGGDVIAVGKSGLKISSNNYGQTWAGLGNTLTTSSDLYSVTSYNFSGDLTILTPGKTYYCSGYPSYPWSTYTNTPSMGTIRASTSGGLTGVGSALYTSYNAGQTWSQNTNYNYAPLNGRDIAYRSNLNGSIATDHGVYTTSPSGFSVWEFQNSSAGYYLNGIAFSPSSINIGLAVGKNGVVLRTNNAGGPSAPYVKYYSANGACVDSTVGFTNVSPSVYTFNWKNNSVQFSTAYNSSFTYNTIGNYTVSLLGNNGVTSDSFTSIIHIVNPPDFTKTYSASNALLCKSGSSDISVHNSDIGVDYILCKYPSLTPVDTVAGNGADAVLNTGIISDSTVYRIKAMINGVSCGGFLSGTILIGVEKTKANFHAQLINAELGENVNYINKSRQAATYNWTFGGGSSINSSVLINPPYITYNLIGQKSVTLEAISIHGCHDTITKNGPFVFDNAVAALNSACWVFNIDGQNPGFLYETEKTYDLKTDGKNNLIIGGAYTKAIFPSRAGVTFGRTTGYGHYVAKYNSNGVLKWLVYSKDSIAPVTNPSQGGSIVRHIEMCSDNSIIVAGAGGGYIRLFTNTGDSVNLGKTDFILKLDSTGKLMWYTTFLAYFPGTTGLDIDFGFKIDRQENIYLTAASGLQNVYSSVYGNAGTYNTAGLCKFNKNGKLLWINKEAGGDNITTDKWSNVYLSGSASYTPINFYSINGDSVAMSCSHPYMIKYDSSGMIKWALSFCVTGTTINGISADSAANIYITGACEKYYGDSLLFPSVHKSTLLRDVGPYFVAAYDSSGDFKWAEGINHYIASAGGEVVSVSKQSANVYTSAIFPYTSGPNVNFSYTSANNLFAPMQQNIYNCSYYIASYDTTGILNFANCETGTVNTNQTGAVPSIHAISDDKNSNIYFAGRLRGSIGYQMLGTTVYPNNQDGFIAKLQGCIVPNSFTNAIDLKKALLSVHISPNPTKDKFTVKANEFDLPLILTLTDSYGLVIMNSVQYSEEGVYDLNRMAAGMYFLKTTNPEGANQSHKIILVK
jgi:photosystem II stability/assembly factor-like uncharacterized protein